MKTTIDAAGRIVVPKALRQELGLKPGQLLEMRTGDGKLEVEIAPYRAKKDTVQFKYTKPVPYDLIARIARARVGAG